MVQAANPNFMLILKWVLLAREKSFKKEGGSEREKIWFGYATASPIVERSSLS